MSAQDTHQKETTHIDETRRRATGTAQWLLEKKGEGVQVDFITNHDNRLEVLICGSNGFASIAKDIRRAKSSIDIICWGFDPGMELERGARANWPRGETFGELLRAAATRGVKVRLLAWYGWLGDALNGAAGGASNLRGYQKPTSEQAIAGASAMGPQEQALLKLKLETTTALEHDDFNASWYQDAVAGRIANLSLRTRNPSADAMKKALAGEAGRRTLLEDQGMQKVATHHQKSVLIDYAHEGGANAVGYIMGLNSVTDYWDTPSHLFHDERRGLQSEGDGDASGVASLKPYQDYACRMRGEALFAVHRNFAIAWNAATQHGKASGDKADPALRMPQLASRLPYPRHSAQVLRTQPDGGVLQGPEKSIKALYHHSIDYAQRYIYVENQYFQNAPWAQAVVAARQKYMKAYAARPKGKHAPQRPPELHLIAVIPTPEKKEMVPRTHDMVAALGHGDSVVNQQKALEDEIDRRNQMLKVRAQFDAARKQASGAPGPGFNSAVPPPNPAPLSDLAQEYVANRNSQDELRNTASLRTLIASLWTYNDHWLEPETGWKDATLQAVGLKKEARIKEEKAKSRYREIYIHSKLMIIDDSMFTLGSANLNTRSFATDSELNIASNEYGLSKDLRQRVWRLHSTADGRSGTVLDGGGGSHEEIAFTFEEWEKLAQSNFDNKTEGKPLEGFLVNFYDERTSTVRLG